MIKYSVRFDSDSEQFTVVKTIQNSLSSVNEVVFCSSDESMALSWIQCTEFEDNMDIYNEFG